MTTVVLTSSSGAYDALADITHPTHQAYARKHGYDSSRRSGTSYGIPPLWWKLCLVDQMLRHYERVLWLDADVVVTDPEIRLDDFNALRIHFSRDWGEDAIDDSHFSSGAYLVHDTQACVVAEALAQDQFRDSAFGDQDAFRFVYKNPPLPLSLFHIHPRRKFNAVHPEIGPSVIEPWQPGDFLCHLTMVPIKKRIELAKRLTSI